MADMANKTDALPCMCDWHMGFRRYILHPIRGHDKLVELSDLLHAFCNCGKWFDKSRLETTMIDHTNGFLIFKNKHFLIERDAVMHAKRLPWFSLGFHIDWQKPHIILYLGHIIITIGETYWGEQV